MFWILLVVFSAVQAVPIRICVPESLSEACRHMSGDHPEVFSCVVSPDTFDCLKKMVKGEADLTNVDPGALYAAGKFYNLQPITTELVDGENFRYQGIALVRKQSDIQSASDLRNKSSCHTGLGRTVGWQIPLGTLLSSGIMSPDCDEGELGAVRNFFDGSCVPGPWSSDPIVDQKLKSRYPNLCSRCKNPSSCSKDDAYAGYEGVMRCLSEGAADVAFTKVPALKEYLEKHPEFAEEAEILCFEGGRKSVLDTEPCIWGARPTNAFVARTDDPEEEERLVGILLQTQSMYSVPQVRTPEWYHKVFLSHPKVSGLRPVNLDRRNYAAYLGDFIHTIRKPQRGCKSDAAFCVTSDEENAKCEEYSKAAEAKGLWPDVECVKAASKAACMQILKEDNSQLLVLDGGDVYKAGKYFDLQPIASELYGESDASYYAVAVLRSASDVTKLIDLQGLRSCHTGIGRTAGWLMPIGALSAEGLINLEGNCNHIDAVADFFSAGSCIPGANDTKYNRDRVRSADLCKHCVGNEESQHKCSRDSKERFSGYSGALRCLAEGKGDVAFVKHTTVPDYTDGHSQLPWTKDLISSDFRLLCGEGGTASVTEFKECNLGKVPSHQVVKSKTASINQRMVLARLLADSSKLFSRDSAFYRLFGPGDKPDLLFKDSATGLRIVPMDSTYEEVLGRRFLEASKALDPKLC